MTQRAHRPRRLDTRPLPQQRLRCAALPPGFRIYFFGMVLRGAAMWMPLVAIPWLAVEAGATPAEIGAITAMFFLPTLFIGALSGVLADRAERRNVLMMTQVSAAILATLTFLLVISDTASLLTLGLAMMGFGVLIAVEVPVRQAFMIELVPRSEIASAASLHATALERHPALRSRPRRLADRDRRLGRALCPHRGCFGRRGHLGHLDGPLSRSGASPRCHHQEHRRGSARGSRVRARGAHRSLVVPAHRSSRRLRDLVIRDTVTAVRH